MSTQAKLIDILLVEDSRYDVELARHVFESFKVGNRLHVVASGEEALDFLYRRNVFANSVRPDIILMDLHLPLKDGHEVLKILRDDPQFKKIPVVILTGSDVEDDAVRNDDLHANSYLSKPVTFFSFINAIHSIEEFWLGLMTFSNASNEEPEKIAS